MEQPPASGNPYDFVSPSVTYPGAAGVVFAWDVTRLFYGRVINEAWTDMATIQSSGVIVV